MPKLTINGMEIEVEQGTSIIQAAEQLGVEVPRFCYHDRLSVPANCRMCLVEVEGAPKPVASCAMPCGENMKVHTDSDLVKKARKGVMEFLLINHPLDCPICDQGGECDLQDQAMGYGFDRSRYKENKRAVKNKELGPLVKTIMTRCIHCTRCVRFGEEIAGLPELGVLNRGEDLEIGTYVEQMVTSEMSGNIIDICPVGALTSKPYAFKARPWELRKTETVDVSDAVGSNIRVDARGGEVLRVLPRLHEDINEEWISDKTRFSYDGLKRRRLDRPWVRNARGKLEEATWDDAFAAVAAKLTDAKPKKIGAIAGDLVDCESVMALKDLMDALKSPNMDCRQDGAQFDASVPEGYRFNTTIAGIEQADAILLIGTNPRAEAALVNARIRKTWLANRIKIGLIGPEDTPLNYPFTHLGNDAAALEELLAGKSPFAKILDKAERPMLVLGAGALNRGDAAAIQYLAREIAEKFGMVGKDWNGYNMLHTAAGRVGALELGFVPGKGGMDASAMLGKGKLDVLYLLGADGADLSRLDDDTFVIYQGHHGDVGAHAADVILPGAAFTEKHAIYVNTEGRAQMARQAVFPPGEAREDWKIIRALSGVLGEPLPYDNLVQLRGKLSEAGDAFADIDTVPAAKWRKFGKKGKLNKSAFKLPVDDFYMTDPISRASNIMAECSARFTAQNEGKKTGTDG